MDSEIIDKQGPKNNPWEDLTKYQSPRTSPDPTCKRVLRIIESSNKMNDVFGFVDEKLRVTPKVYQSVEGFNADNPGYEETFINTLNMNEKGALKDYTFSHFAWVNSLARGFWDYEKLGKYTPEAEAKYQKTIENISEAIEKSPATRDDFLTFRGTNLDGFRSYGVHQLSDLKNLEGQFYLEQGFTSTALVRERGFAERKESSLWVGSSNIEVRYHIPAGSGDVAALFSKELSHSTSQTEVLIDKFSLSYISNVEYDSSDHAIVNMLLIPRNIYDEPPKQQ